MSLLRALLVLGLLASLLVTGGTVGATGLTVVDEVALSDRLREITVFSPAMERDTTLRVLLPTGYDPEDEVDYPVLYLLHGCCDTYRSWSDKTDLEEFTADLDVLVVMPDAGAAGFYTDWYNHGANGTPRWESYHIGELIPWVEATYDVKAERNGRLLAGLSMGGFGSFTYASRHPDLFVSAAAFSPAIDTNITGPVAVDLSLLDQQIPYSAWGSRTTEEVRWRGDNPWDLAENLAPLDLWIITGDGTNASGAIVDPVEFYVWQQAHSVHDRLTELGIDHYFEDYGAGGHTWDLWQRDLHLTLPQQLAHAASEPDAPSDFTFTAIERSYDVFGWGVDMARGVLEFSRLEVTGTTGFAVEGTGTAHVRTAGIFDPEQTYEVRIDDGAPLLATPDADGRLQVSVDLGPANQVQQFTALGEAVNEDPVRAEVHITPVGS